MRLARNFALVVWGVGAIGCGPAVVVSNSGGGGAETTTSSTDVTTQTSMGGAGGGGTTTATTTSPGTGGAGGCETTCSADLKEVLSCDGTVLQTCNPDQGCANGACIDGPCEAATLSKSSFGCSFWAVKTDIIEEAQGGCFAAFIANTWSSPVHIQVERDGAPLAASSFVIPKGQGQSLTYMPYDSAGGLPSGEVAILFLSREAGGFLPDCPLPAALSIDSGVTGTGKGKAFKITTDRPVVAYQMLPYGGGNSAATSASLLFPTSAWDVNYVAVNAYPKSAIAPGQPTLAVVANENGTQVTLLPKVPVVGGPGVEAGPASLPKVYTLNAGEYLQISQDQELTGSPIEANKPVGLWGGSSCFNVPVDQFACDTGQQQIAPVKATGHEYAAVRYRNRGAAEESPPWRMVGMVNGTTLTYVPAKPPGAPDALNLGQVAEFASPGGFVVTSQDAQHPFYMAAYMTAGQNFNGVGDPEWVSLVSTEQYLDRYVLFTDPTYPETNLVVVRKPDANGNFAEVKLDCLGDLVGWQALGPYQYTRWDLSTGNFQDVGACSNGRHEMSSEGQFGVTVWGWGSPLTTLYTQYVSYAYPAGARLQHVNDVVVVSDP